MNKDRLGSLAGVKILRAWNVAQAELNPEFYVRANVYERQFHRPIFFGNENCEDEVLILSGLIKYACDILSGLQQPDHSPDEETAEQCRIIRERDEASLELIRQDICV